MAKKLVYNYEFDASAQTIKIGGNYSVRKLILITNTTDGVIIYNFADPSAGATVYYDTLTDKTTITLEYNTTAMSDSDELQILADDGGDTKIDAGESLIDPVHKFRVSNPQNLIDTDFEYGLQPTKWETIELVDNIPSVYTRGSGVSIGEIREINTVQSSDVVTVKTQIAHDLGIGDPIEVQGASSRTANGKYVVVATPSNTEFLYRASAIQSTTGNVKTAYATVIPGSFFSGSDIVFQAEEGIATDNASNSNLSIKTDYKHGLSADTSVYIRNTVGKKEFTLTNTSSIAADGKAGITTVGVGETNSPNSIYIENHNLYTGQRLTVYPDTGGTLPTVPQGAIVPEDDKTINIVYEGTKRAVTTIHAALQAAGRDGVLITTNSNNNYALYNNTYRQGPFSFHGGTHYQYIRYGQYDYQRYAYWTTYSSSGSYAGQYRGSLHGFYNSLVQRDNLLSGEAVNLSGTFVKTGGIGKALLAGTNFWWSQNTPYSQGAAEPFIIKVDQYIPQEARENPNQSVSLLYRSDYRYYYNQASNSYPYRYSDYHTESYGSGGYGAFLNAGNGWEFSYSVTQYDYYTSTYLCYANYQICLRNSNWDALYTDGAPSKTLYTYRGTYNRTYFLNYPDRTKNNAHWEIEVLIPYDQYYSLWSNSNSSGTVYTHAQVATAIVQEVIANLNNAQWQNSVGVNTVRAISLDSNRIGLRDGVDGGQLKFTDSGTGPIKIETDQVAGVVDNYYNVTSVGATSLSISAGTQVPPRTLEFTNTDVILYESLHYIRIPGGHGLQNGQKLTFNVVSGAGVPGLNTAQIYYAIVVDDVHIQLGSSYTNAISGTNVISGVPSGSGSYNVQVFSINGRVSAPGLVSIAEGSSVVSGSDTRFTSTYKIGDNFNVVSIGTAVNNYISRKIISIVGDTTLALDSAVGAAFTSVNHYVDTTVNVRADGTFLHRPFDGGVEITAGKSPDSTIVRQTRKYFRYQSGKGIQISMAINFNPARPVQLATGSGSAITMTTEYPHGLTAGDTVLITGAEEISQHTPTGAAYDPVTGMFTITQNGHGFQVGEEVFFAEGSFTLRCALNSYGDDHPYPRSTDPAGGGARLPIISTTANTYVVDVGTSTNTSAHNVTAIATNAVSHVDTSNGYNGTYKVTSATDFTFSYTGGASVTQSPPGGFIDYVISGYKNAAIRAGLFDFQNGFFFEYDGKDLFCVRRSSVQQLAGTITVENNSNVITGLNTRFVDQLKNEDRIVIRGQTYKVTSIESNTSIHMQPSYRGTSNSGVIVTKTVDTRVKQSNWNIDKADGTGPSGYVLDINKIQMAYMDYSWYGAGKIRFGFKDTYGHVKYTHEFIHNNKLNEAYMRSGNVPARYEVLNKGIPTYVPSLFHWGTSVIMDGGFDDDDSYLFTASGNTLTFTNGDADTAVTSNASSLYSQRVGWRYYNYYVRLPFASSDASKFQTGVPLYTDDGALNGEAVAFTSYSGSSFYVYILISSGYSAPGAYPSVNSGTTVNIGAPTVGASGVDLTSRIPLISIRLAPSADNNLIGELGERDIINRMQLKMQELGISVSHDANISVILNGSLSNLAYDNVGTPSLSQYIAHDAGDTIEEGTLIYQFRASGGSEDANGRRLTASNAFDLSTLTDLGNSILGGDGVFPNGPDIITIAASVINTAQIDKTSAFQVASRISWAESQA